MINKKLLRITALVITLVGMAINFFFAKAGRPMPLALTMRGGETFIDIGFGLRYVNIYSMTPGGHNSHQILPSPVSFIVCYLGIYAILSFGAFLLLKIRKTR